MGGEQLMPSGVPSQDVAAATQHHRRGGGDALKQLGEPLIDALLLRLLEIRCPLRLGEAMKVIALGGTEPQGARKRVDDLRRGVERLSLLQPRVIGGAHSGQHGDLLAAQAGHTSLPGEVQPDVLRVETGTRGGQELAEAGHVGCGHG